MVVVGQTQAQDVYEIMGRKGELAPAQTLLRTRYEEGLEAYRARRWDEAQSAFAEALAAVPGDGPAITMMSRIDVMRQSPPPDDWDGAWRLESK